MPLSNAQSSALAAVNTRQAIAAASAAMTAYRWERHWVSKSRPGLANHAMANVVWNALQHVGPPVWDVTAKCVASDTQRTLGMAPMEDPFIDEMTQLVEPKQVEAILRRDLSPSQLNSTSDDYTDMTWHTPTARFYIARPALKAPASGPYPPWVMNALGGIPATIDPMVQTAAKVLACAAIRLLEDPSSRKAAMDEFKTRTGGGIGGTTWQPPLCDYDPPIHFRWPEYINTPRGRDWWIPSAMPGA